MYKRPQRGESEEDLLKLQEEFLEKKDANKITPAAKVDVSGKIETEQQQENEPEELSNTFEQIPNYESLGNIVEKVNTNNEVLTFKLQKTGFPVAKRRESSKHSHSGSIFSQQMKKLKSTNEGFAEHSQIVSIRNFPSQSYIVTGNDKHEIHRKNVDQLNEMTEKEILEERNKLMSTMDPAIVAFLKSRRYNEDKINNKMEIDMEQQINAAADIRGEDISTVSAILECTDSEKWINFDKMELSKLAWMKDVNLKDLKKNENYEARFDFAGWLLPYVEDEINEKNRILYHHGDEPGRPGYTLQELFQLSRSNIIQQKITALNAIANLLSLETTGVYDDVIDIPVEQVFFVLRFCLDDNIPFVLNAGIKAMRNLFVYPIDEICLDSLLGFGLGRIQPTLLSEQDDKDDDYTVNDQQLAETNLIKCLSRTEILTRIRYIINTVKPPLETICYALELLTRLSRDSLRIANLVFNCEGLISNIITHFLPETFKENVSNVNYGVPLKQAVKLIRILSTRSKSIAVDFVNKFHVMNSVTMYLSNEHFSSNTTGVQLQTECLHLWDVFVNYNLALEHFTAMQPILLQMLHYHIRNTSQDISSSYTMQRHVAAILILIGSTCKFQSNNALLYINLLTDQAINKWITQFNNSNKFMCGKLVIISSLFHCISCLYESKINIDYEKINNAVKMMIQSNGFKMVTSDIKTSSNILSKYEAHEPSKNLLTVEASVWNASEHIVPILQTNSSLPFLNTVSKFITTSDCIELKILFLQHENLKKYFECITQSKSYNLTSNWFTQIESEFIINILKISFSVYRNIDTSIFYDIAVKCLCIFNSNQKEDVEFILKNIIFNRSYYPSHVLLQNLEMEDSVMSDCVNNLNDIFYTYIEVLGLQLDINYFKDNMCMDIKIGNIIPVDWIYSPIIVLYADSQKNENKLPEARLIFIIQNCLRWIFIYEKYFSSLASLINPVDKFCRLACVFLTSDDVFFVPEIRTLLQASFKHFIANDLEKLDFKKKVHGLTNFQDFYTQLLEQYQGVSYGDALFSNVVLIPLMQKENVQYRKLLWSEYAGIVQICNISTEQLMCPLEIFLEPPETDISLLRCYRRCITGRIKDNSIIKIIAKHHLDNFVKNKKTS